MHWAGVRFDDLLALVEPLPAAKAIRFVSLEEPYDDSLTLEQARLAERDARATRWTASRCRARTARRRAS